jgi:hypothetical protein
MMGTGAIAGIGGIPLYAAAEGASRVLTDKPLMNNIYNWMGYADAGPVGQKAIDAFYYGLPALAGVTFQGRAEAPSSDLVRDITQMHSMMMMDRTGAATKAIGEMWETWQATGQSPFRNPKVRSLTARAFLPRTMYKFLQRSAQGGLKSLSTGSPLISDVSLPEHVWYSLGVTPLKVQQDRDLNRYFYDSEQSLNAQVSQMGQLMSDAYMEKDYVRYNELLRQALFRDSLPFDRVLRSQKAFDAHKSRESAASALTLESQMEKRMLLGR